MDTAAPTFQIELFDLKPMNCQAAKTYDELGDLDQFLLEPKLDGFRLVAHVLDDKVLFYTRSLKRQDGKLPLLEAELLDRFPAGTVLDGEIVALYEQDGRIVNDFEHVQSVMLSKPEEAVRKAAQIRPVHFVIFDMFFHNEQDMRQEALTDRKAMLDFYMQGGTKPSHFSLIASAPASQAAHDLLVEKGFEGTIAKRKTSKYCNGKRGKKYGWFKFKHVCEIDAVVLGFLDAKVADSKNLATFGSILFGQPMVDMPAGLDKAANVKVHSIDGRQYVERGSCTGITDAMRIWLHQNCKPGDVISVKHMGVYPDGIRMRHPQFLRYRDPSDKTFVEVTWHDA